ncbi:hypothetical protein ACFSL4_23305 [Streptomyces caeni]|uniref:Transcriptional regulator n=1 Tax=Streptomyces caeni TaxID=2307231 RepID=A0ABW4IVT2_9ACTN
MAALQVRRRVGMQVIRALRDTRLERGKTLAEHGKLLGALVSGQVAMTKQLQAITDHFRIRPPEAPPEA